MQSQPQDKIRERRQRLIAYLEAPEWKDLKQEIQMCYDNADAALHAFNCLNRDIYVGKCLAIKEILNIDEVISHEQ